jgi:SH3 domain
MRCASRTQKQEKEISFRTGDVIVNVEIKSDIWWYGRRRIEDYIESSCSYGEYGWFPGELS